MGLFSNLNQPAEVEQLESKPLFQGLAPSEPEVTEEVIPSVAQQITPPDFINVGGTPVRTSEASPLDIMFSNEALAGTNRMLESGVEGVKALPGVLKESAVPVARESIRKAFTGIVQLPSEAASLGLEALSKTENLRPKSKQALEELSASFGQASKTIGETSKKALGPEAFDRPLSEGEELATDIFSLGAGGVKGAQALHKQLPEDASFARKLATEGVGAIAGEGAVGIEQDPLLIDLQVDLLNKRLPIETGVFTAGSTLLLKGLVGSGRRTLGIKNEAQLEKAAEVIISTPQNYTGEMLIELQKNFDVEPDVIAQISSGKASLEIAAGQDAAEKIFTNKSYVNEYVNRWSKLDNLERARAAKSGIDVGAKDILERSKLSPIKNEANQGGTLARALIGDIDQTSVLRYSGNGSQLVEDTSIKPLKRIYYEARQNGVDVNELNTFFAAQDALDEAANLQRKRADILNSIEVNKDNKSVVDKLNADLKALDAYKPRMDLETANKVIGVAQHNPVFRQALKDKNNINNLMLDMLTESGKIGADDAARIRAAHPNYVPAFKEITDLTSGTKNPFGGPTVQQPIKKRKGRDLPQQDVFEAQMRNIIKTTRAVQRARINRGILEFLMRSPEDELQFVFRESKEEIVDALQRLKGSDTKRLSAQDIRPDPTVKAGNVVFDIDGKQLELTVLDNDIVELLNNTATQEKAGLAYRFVHGLSTLSRNLITTFDPTFNVRSLEREAQDFPAMSKRAGFVRPLLRGEKPDYIPLFSNIKALATKETDPELYRMISANYGFNNIWGESLEGLSDDQIIKGAIDSLEGKHRFARGVEKTKHAFYGMAERVDLAPRILNYKILRKQGYNHDEAMRVSFSIGVEFAQAGTNNRMREAMHLVPFATAFLNGSDRLIRLGRYEPKKLASAFMLGVYPLYKAVELNNQQYTDENGVPYVDQLSPDMRRFTLPIYGPWSKGPNDYVPFSLGWTLGRATRPFDQMLDLAYAKLDKGIREVADAAIENVTGTNSNLAAEAREAGVTGHEVSLAFTNYITDLAAFPSAIPGVSQGIQIAQNEDWLGRQIVPDRIKQDLSSELWREFDANTSPAVVAFAKNLRDVGVNVSPKVTEYLLESTLAGFGKLSLGLADSIYSVANEDAPEQPELETRDIPGSKAVVGNIGGRVLSGISSQYHRTNAHVRGILDSHATLVNQAKKYPDTYMYQLEVFEEKYAKELAAEDLFKSTNKELKKLYEQLEENRFKDSAESTTPERELLGDPKKRERLNQLYNKIENLQRNVLDTIEEQSKDDDIYFERYDKNLLQKFLDNGSDILKSIGDAIVPDANAAPIPTDKPAAPLPVTAGTYNPTEANQIESDEGVTKNSKGQHIAYLDTLNRPTLGHGHLMTKEEIKKYPIGSVVPDKLVEELWKKDLDEHWDIVRTFQKDGTIPKDTPNEVIDILFNMAFNLGETKLRGFPGMLGAINRKDWQAAADEMVDSQWYGQVGDRSKRLVRRMRNVGRDS